MGNNETIENIAIIIPVYGADYAFKNSLESILKNNCQQLIEVVVVLDRCDEHTENLVKSFVHPFAQKSIHLFVERLPTEVFGKVEALIHGGNFISTKNVLLLDSDIILDENAIQTLLHFHVSEGHTFSSCLIYPYDGAAKAHSFAQKIVCNNRLYRQSVIQTVKNLYGCSNFPGGVQMVDFAAYKRLLKDGFLEDLTATYSLLKTGGRIAILPNVLAYEVERKTILGQFLQRVRWTIGAIQHISEQIATARTRKSMMEKMLINSYHIMWEFQYYIIFINLILIFFFPSLWIVLSIPMLLYMLNILRSVRLTWQDYRNSYVAALFHCLIHPIIISVALPSAVGYIIYNRSYNFQSKSLFHRI